MNINKENLITSKQFMILIFSTMIGVGIISTPYLLVKEVGHNAWLSALMSGIISILLTIIISRLLNIHKDKSIFGINKLLYGKYAGMALNSLYLLYLILKTSIILRLIIEIIHIIIMKTTPSLILSILALICPFYMAFYGLKPICRFSNFVFLILVEIIFLYFVSFSHIRLSFLLPVGNISLPSLLYSMRSTAFSFLGFAFLWLVYPVITDKKNALKYTIWAMVLSTLLFTSTIVVTMGYFGENMLKHIIFPVYYLALVYKVPVFERIDLIFLVIWFPALSMTLKAYFFVTYYWLYQATGYIFPKIKSNANAFSGNNKNKNSLTGVKDKKKKIVFLILFSILIVAVSRILKDYNHVLKTIEITDMIGVSLISGMAIIDLIISLIKNAAGSKNKFKAERRAKK